MSFMLGRDSQTIRRLVEGNVSRDDALLAENCDPLSYEQLAQQIDTTLVALNYFGIGRGDSVALALPDGPLAAAAFLSLASGAICAPLDPSCRTEEFEFRLRNLEAKALVVESGVDSPATHAAQKLGVRLLESKPRGPSAGSFVLQGEPGPAPERGGPAQPDDIAVILPNNVALSHRDVCSSATAMARTLGLTSRDLCLNFLPLFDIPGLISTLLSSIVAGASVYCTPRFNAAKFFGQLDQVKPSWYSAAPPTHQAILFQAARSERVRSRNTLRFIHSSSAVLPPQLQSALEEAFGVPVVES